MKRGAGGVLSWDCSRSVKARTSQSNAVVRPPPPPTYWLTTSEDHEGGSHSIFTTRYMRRKLEYLLRQTAAHPDGCLGKKSLSNARVVSVERIENHTLWEQYAQNLASQKQAGCWKKSEKSRPINCDLADGERYLFHGTLPENLDGIASDGFDRTEGSGLNRYGQGIYFSDESCKAHQYAGCRVEEDGSEIHCMLYCRVLPGKTLEYKTTKADRAHNFLQGMLKPAPTDPVFRHALTRRGATAKVGQKFDSLVVEADRRGVVRGGEPAQVHREVVVFDAAQVYPEYIVWYRTDTEEEEQERREEFEMLLMCACAMTLRRRAMLRRTAMMRTTAMLALCLLMMD